MGYPTLPYGVKVEGRGEGFHDISSKVISPIRRFVDYDISSMRHLGD